MDFPKAAEVASDAADSPAGKTLYHTFTVDLPEGGLLVTYVDYPNEIAPPERLKMFVDGHVAGRPLISDKACAAGAVPGREVSFRAEKDGNVITNTSRTFVVGNRLYNVFIFRISGAGMNDARVKELLDTFRLLP